VNQIIFGRLFFQSGRLLETKRPHTLDRKEASKPIVVNRHDGFEVVGAGNRHNLAVKALPEEQEQQLRRT
jgi:hypothetical protein